MAVFTAQYTVSYAADCSTYTVFDTSSYTDEPKNTFSSRQLQIIQADGTSTLVDFSFAAYPTDSITFPYNTDISLNIILILTSINPVAGSTYTSSRDVPLLCNLIDFRLDLIHDDVAVSPTIVNDINFFSNLLRLQIDMDNAVNAADGFDIYSSQDAIMKALYLQQNQAFKF